MGVFVGTLNPNEIYSSLYNMIISQQVFADKLNFDDDDLVAQARVDGSLYGDIKLYYDADVLKTHDWLNDAEAQNLLALDRPDAPEVQSVVLDQFRQIRLTLDEYLSKRAWSDEGAFGQFNSVMEGYINKTKSLYDYTIYNAYFGTAETSVGKQLHTITIASGTAPDVEARTIGQDIADLLVDIAKPSRDYNDYGHMTKFSKKSIKIVWNSLWVNKIEKLETPVIFHREGLVDKFAKDVIPSVYFGEVNAAATPGDGSLVRSLVEQDIGSVHVYPGELIPSGETAPAGTSYTEDPNIICKVLVEGKLPAYMSAFQVGTTFFNPRSLTTNRYLTFGHNTLEYFKAFPFVTVKAN